MRDSIVRNRANIGTQVILTGTGNMSDDVMSLKDWVEIATNGATIMALLAGGWWTYALYVRQRLRYPRAELDIAVEHAVIEPGKRLVHVAVKVVNRGHVLLQPKHTELRVRQVIPIHNAIAPTLQTEGDPVLKGKHEIEWPLIFQRRWNGAFELEPGESDCLHADFVLLQGIELIQLYTFVSNPTQKRPHFGWQSTKFVFLSEVPVMADQETQESPKRKQQERQQEQQQQQQQQTGDDAGSGGDSE